MDLTPTDAVCHAKPTPGRILMGIQNPGANNPESVTRMRRCFKPRQTGPRIDGNRPRVTKMAPPFLTEKLQKGKGKCQKPVPSYTARSATSRFATFRPIPFRFLEGSGPESGVRNPDRGGTLGAGFMGGPP